MSKTLRILCLTLFAAIFCSVSVGAATLQEGRDYELVNPPQPSEVKGKIEVIEFFSYVCPHCAHFDPALSTWLKALPRDVVFRRVPVIFRPQWEAPARLYYTLETLGELGKLHTAVFDAIHSQGVILFSESAVTDWAVGKGVDRKKFSDVFNSFSVQSKVQRAKQMTGAYVIAGVPTLVVAGKYRTPENYPGNHEEMLKLVDGLIAKARAEQK